MAPVRLSVETPGRRHAIGGGSEKAIASSPPVFRSGATVSVSTRNTPRCVFDGGTLTTTEYRFQHCPSLCQSGASYAERSLDRAVQSSQTHPAERHGAPHCRPLALFVQTVPTRAVAVAAVPGSPDRAAPTARAVAQQEAPVLGRDPGQCCCRCRERCRLRQRVGARWCRPAQADTTSAAPGPAMRAIAGTRARVATLAMARPGLSCRQPARYRHQSRQPVAHRHRNKGRTPRAISHRPRARGRRGGFSQVIRNTIVSTPYGSSSTRALPPQPGRILDFFPI